MGTIRTFLPTVAVPVLKLDDVMERLGNNAPPATPSHVRADNEKQVTHTIEKISTCALKPRRKEKQRDMQSNRGVKKLDISNSVLKDRAEG